MSSAKHILAMLRSQAEGNADHFYSIALQVAAAEARQGRGAMAKKLREAIEKARSNSGQEKPSTTQFARPRENAEWLIEMRRPKTRLPNVVLSSCIQRRLDDFVKQQVKRSWLREYGKAPNCNALLIGPPGTGKSMTAEAMAGTLHLPFFMIRLESVFTRNIRETHEKLRVIFSEIACNRGVYLFEDFEAIAVGRHTGNDAAERRRALICFLQLMEEPNSTDSPVLAAADFSGPLDRAIPRRFDMAIKFPKPTDDQAKQLIKNYLPPARLAKPDWESILKSARGLSHSEIARAAENASSSAILDETREVSSADLKLRLDERSEMSGLLMSEH